MKRVAIIGSGIAGAATAYTLHRYGTTVTVYEQHSSITPEASGNPAALVMPRLDVGDTPEAQFHRDSFVHTVHLYEHLGAFTARGVTDTSNEPAKVAKLMANPPLPADYLEQRGEALFHHRAGVIEPRATIEKLLHGCTIHLNQNIDDICLTALAHEYDAVVLCGGRLLAQFHPTRILKLDYRLGQVDWVEGSIAPTMGDGYAIPHKNHIIFGATHNHWYEPTIVPAATAEATAHNIESLKFLSPKTAIGATQSRTAIRTTTPRHMPLAGLVTGNIYALGALGSRGFTTAPWLAEHIAAGIMGIPSPLSIAIQKLIVPERFSTLP